MHKKQSSRGGIKKLIIILAVVIAAAGAVLGAVTLLRRSGGEVNVYPASDFIMDARWMSSGSQTDGVVSTDRIQSVYVSSTQQITDIYVTEGQTVRAGDPILSFDTTLSELELQRQAIKVDQLRLDIQNAEDELREIGTYRVGSGGGGYIMPADSGNSYTPVAYMPFDRSEGSLGTGEDPLIYLWNDGCVFSVDFIRLAAATALENREAYRQTHGAEPSEPVTPAEPAEAAEPETPAEPEAPVLDGEAEAPAEEAQEALPDAAEPAQEPAAPAEPAEPAEPMPEGIDDPHIYVVFEVRESDSLSGGILRSWEMVFLLDESTGSWSFQMIEPVYDPGETDYVSYEYYYDTAVYYTASEIARMKAECSQKITDLTLQLKQAELEYDRLSYELSSGEVVSRIDGVIKTVRDADEARQEGLPVVLVSGGGGYYVTAVLGEMELGSMRVGDTVSVQSWENYETFEGTITEISEYPDESNRYWYYSEGNQNVSHYPFRVFVDEDASLREGEYVTLTYSPDGEDAAGLFLEPAFVRQENGKSYIFAAGDDGLLEKRFVRTGGNTWGWIEVYDGLSEDDYIAFPYGRQTRDGAKLRYAETDEFYSSMRY